MTQPHESHPPLSIPRLVANYYAVTPRPASTAERVAFGTSGHRGTSDAATFNEQHILAITQAIVEYRTSRGITGPLFLAADTHALSTPALYTALEVLAANRVHVYVHDGPVPTPVLSYAVRLHNRQEGTQADGIVITPSHNPPGDGGLKYNPPHGGPAETPVTAWIEDRANAHMADENRRVLRQSLREATQSEYVHEIDMLAGYVAGIEQVVHVEAIAHSGVRIGVDPMGGASLETWDRIAEAHRLDLTVVERTIDPTFAFMPLDHDGVVRMDCSSSAAMAGLLRHQHQFAVAVGNDPDADRHGIVTPKGGLLHPNHFYAVVLDYLARHRAWQPGWGLGRTIVTSMLLDRIAASHGLPVYEVPVGFKWFVPGLDRRELGFAAEESAGASLLTRSGETWTTDKDGIVMGLLAAEMTAELGEDIFERYEKLTETHGQSHPLRRDVAATAEMKTAIIAAKPTEFTQQEVAGSEVVNVLNEAGGEPIGGVKVVTADGWFAARPSGTEALYKIYAESLVSTTHAEALLAAGEDVVNALLAKGNGDHGNL